MLSDFLHWLLAVFVFQPIQAEIDARLQSAQVPRAAVQQLQGCVTRAAPALVETAGGDWLWTAKTVVSVAAGLADPIDVLAAEAPNCRAAVDAVRPFLRDDNRA
jgi:hypothetical protein